MLNRKKQATTATQTETPTPDRQRQQATERQRTAVVALLGKLDTLELGDLLADARATLDRAQTMRVDFAQAYRDLRDRYEDVRDQVIGGSLAPADAVAQLATLAPIAAKTDTAWSTLSKQLEDETVNAIEAEAVHLARRDAHKVHTTLSKKATEIVSAAVDAAAVLFPLDRYADGVRQAMRRALERPFEAWDSERGCLARWPVFDLSSVEPMRLGVVGSLRDLTARLSELHDTAHVLAALAPGMASVLYRAPATRADQSYLERWTPPELRIAVAAKLGWTPGLWLATDAKPRPDEQGSRFPTSGQRPDHGESLISEVTRGAVASVPEQQHEARAGGLAGLARRFAGH